MKLKILYALLIIAFLTDLFFVYQGAIEPRFFTKTLLLPLLLIIYVLSAKEFSTEPLNKVFIAGLVLSFFGDFFLLFSWGFLPGLGSFLMAHLAYIIAFKKLNQKKISEVWTVLLCVYGSILIGFLRPHLKEMMFPVIIYAIVIVTMLYNAMKTSNQKLIPGAVLFVISDTVLAINLFVDSNTFLSLMVMITYVAAQWFLVQGMLSDQKKI